MRSTLSTLRLALAAALLSLLCMNTLAQQAPSDSSMRNDPVYRKNCSKCHGKDGDGKFMGGPSILTDKTKAMSSEELRNLIISGKTNNGARKMPAFSGMLTPEALDNLVAEIKVAKRPQADKEGGQEIHGREAPAN
jgi:mono/diheme cytochrome c family protein